MRTCGVERLSRPLRELGWFDGLLYLAARALHKLTAGRSRLIKYYIVAQPVPHHASPASRRGSAIAVTPTQQEAVSLLDSIRPREVLRRRIADGALCLVASQAERVVGFLWLSFGDYREDEVRCVFRLDPDHRCVWDFDVWVHPDARMTAAFSRLWSTCNELLAARGTRWSLSRISAFNAGSLRAHARLGARRLGSACFLDFGRLQLSLMSSRPWLHVSASPTRAPTLRVSELALEKLGFPPDHDRPAISGCDRSGPASRS